MEYRPLNSKRNEIRVLTILPSAKLQDTDGLRSIPASSEIVSCELKQVSLDDYTPQYRAFRPDYVPSPKELLLKWKNRDPTTPQTPSARPQYGSLESLRNLKHRLKTRFKSQHDVFDKSIKPRYMWGDFVALSYTWGDPSASESILLNGFPTTVTANLAAALRELRREPCPARGFSLWIDALCINQSDLQERSQQVKRMRDIYSHAWTVVVWLGESDKHSIVALDIIRNIHKGLGDNKDGLVETLKREPEFFGPQGMDSVYRFVGREYWSRVWIIQELVMGSSEMPLLCGESRIYWAVLGEVVDFLFRNFDLAMGSVPYQESRQSRRRLARIQKLLRLSEGEQQYPGKESLTAMLQLSHESRASDERDKIYGVLGLMYTHLADLIVPDYTLDTTAVYTDFSKAIVGGLHDLGHIYRGNRSEPRKIQPSWVYDFRTESDRDYLDHEIPFGACLGAVAFGPIRDDSLNIFCSGIWIDSVQSVSGYSTKDTLASEPASHQLAVSKVNQISPILKDALWRTFCFDAKESILKPVVDVDWQCTVLGIPWCMDALCIDTSMDYIGSLGWGDVYHSEHFFAFDRFRRANYAFEIGGHALKDFFSLELYPLPNAISMIRALERMMAAMFGRRLASTLNGWPALGVCNTLPGDKICVVMGCNMPLLLRPRDSRYEVVGEVYYHGVMYGEVLAWIEQGRAELDSIIIC